MSELTQMEKIKKFNETTNTNESIANYYLKNNHDDIEAAISAYFDDESKNSKKTFQQSSSQKQTAIKKSSNSSNIRTFADLEEKEEEEERDPDDENSFVGGGLNVQGPTGKIQNDIVNKLFGKAQKTKSDDLPDSEPSNSSSVKSKPPNKSSPFSGEGRILGFNSSDSQQQANTINIKPSLKSPSATNTGGGGGLGSASTASSDNDGRGEEKMITITFYRNGFTVDNGPLRSFDDPKSKEILEAMDKGFVPRELSGNAKRVAVKLNDKKKEDYVSPKEEFKAFQSAGRVIGPGLEGNTSPIRSDHNQQQQQQQQQYMKNTAAVMSVDETKPMTSVQLRLPDGSTIKTKINVDQTIGDLFIYIEKLIGLQQFKAATTFPKKQLTDKTETIEKANLKNSVIMITL